MNDEVVTITRIYFFAAAHQLPNHEGKCSQLHGHNYRAEVTAPEGLWFEELDEAVKPVLDHLDHANLNDIIPNPMVEDTARWIYEHIKVPVISVRVWENERSYAEVR